MSTITNVVKTDYGNIYIRYNLETCIADVDCDDLKEKNDILDNEFCGMTILIAEMTGAGIDLETEEFTKAMNAALNKIVY